MDVKDLRPMPTVLVLFGATGNLVSRKIIPALFNLYKHKKLPESFSVVGFSRGHWSDDDYKGFVRDVLRDRTNINISESQLDSFVNIFRYEQGFFDKKENYKKIAESLGVSNKKCKMCSNKLFYLAVSPRYYYDILKNLTASGLTEPCGPDGGWTRVIFEKPFGNSLKDAVKLKNFLYKLFKKEQLYLIDHYLGKDIVQNILAFRFSNRFIDAVLNNKFVERVEIKILEEIGVEGRGETHDSLGAFRDIGQNHMLEILSLLAMERPVRFNPDSVREKRAEVLKKLKKFSAKEVAKYTSRGQYEGYRNIKGVKKNSKTETYFKVNAFVENPKWEGVPFILEGGKRMNDTKKEIVVVFKSDTPCFFPECLVRRHRDELVFSIEPKQSIEIHFQTKIPGYKYELEEDKLNLSYGQRMEKNILAGPYENLIFDCIRGNQMFFVDMDEVEASWKFSDSITRAWEKDCVPLKVYKPNEVILNG